MRGYCTLANDVYKYKLSNPFTTASTVHCSTKDSLVRFGRIVDRITLFPLYAYTSRQKTGKAAIIVFVYGSAITNHLKVLRNSCTVPYLFNN